MTENSVAPVVLSEAEDGDALDSYVDEIMDEGAEQDEPEASAEPEEVEAIDPPTEDEPEAEESDEGEDEYLTVRHAGKEVTLTYEEALDHIEKGLDYTKKTMALGEDRRAFEAQRQQAVELVQTQNKLLQEYAAVIAADEKLKQWGEITQPQWDNWYEQDPIEASKAYRHFQEAKANRDQQINNVRQKQEYLKQQETHQLAQVQAKAAQDLSGAIRGWDGDKAKATREYIASYEALGITAAELQKLNTGVYGAAPIVWAYKAAQFDKLQDSKPVLQKKMAALPKVVKPGNPQPANPPREKQMAQLKAAKTRKGKEAIAMNMLDKYI